MDPIKEQQEERQEKQPKKKTRKNSVLAALCFTMALTMLLSAVGSTLAKYIAQDGGSGTAVAAPFYFSSDKLSEDNPYYQISKPEAGGTVNITFTLSNFVDQLRCTDELIFCYVQVISGTDPEGVPVKFKSARLAGGFHTTTMSFDLRESDFTDGVVTVVAECETPYVKTLSARFGFSDRQHELQWTVSEQENAVVLEVGGGNGGAVAVAWPDTLLPDPADAALSGASGGSVSFSLQPGVRRALTFLKKDPLLSYSKEDFTVTAS